MLAVDTAAATRSRSARPPLGLAAPLAASVVLLGWWLVVFARLLAGPGPGPSDLGEYWVAGQLTLGHGWAAPYDGAAFRRALRAFGGAADAYASSPLATLVVLALRPLPFPAACAAWDGLLLAGVVAACRSAASPCSRLAARCARASWPSPWSGSWPCTAGSNAGAGPGWPASPSGLAFVKPQDVFLVPLALAPSGRRRPALVALATAAGLAAVCAILLGPDGLRACARSISFELGGCLAGRQSPAWALPAGAASLVVRAGIALVALVPAAVDRRRPDPGLAAAVPGSQLATPCLNGADLALLVPCAWLTPGDRAARWLGWAALLSYSLVALAAAAAAVGYRNGRTRSVTSSSLRSAASRPSAGT